MDLENASWLEVSLTVEAELVEPIAEVLARFAPNGVAIEATRIVPDEDGEGRGEGPLRVAAYLPVDEQLEETRRRLEEALWYLGRIRPLPSVEYRPIQETNWNEAWKEHYHPIPVGKSLIVVPAWLASPDPKRTAIRIEPGMAFGTGTHPSTQLCLELLEEILTSQLVFSQAAEAERKAAGEEIDVIDLGCGSGILSIAAIKLGARRVLGVDIDQQAIDAAHSNAVANEVEERLELRLGSLGEILSGKFGWKRAPLVVANILAPVLVRLLDEGLGSLLTVDGFLLLSGILQEQSGEVEAALEQHKLRLLERRVSGDWVALSAASLVD